MEPRIGTIEEKKLGGKRMTMSLRMAGNNMKICASQTRPVKSSTPTQKNSLSNHYEIKIPRQTEMIMTKMFCLLAVLFTAGQIVSAQQLPIIEANSKTVDIRDGDDFRKGNWHISPEVKPDIFYVSRFRNTKNVTFYTDIDSISFMVEPEREYDFIILLHGNDTAFTKISAVTTPAVTFKKKNGDPVQIADTIPFTLGKGNKIYIKGSINNSSTLEFMFDTGSDQEIISKSGLSKNVSIHFDAVKNSTSIGGTTLIQYSEANQLEIGNFIWDNLPIGKIDDADADGIIGYNIFDGKILEINYDKKIMVVHSRPLKVDERYEKIALIFKDNLPFIEATLSSNKKIIKGVFEFDAGSNGSLWINKDFAKENGLYGIMENIGETSSIGFDGNRIENETVLLPQVSFGKYKLTDVPIDLELPSETENLKWGILGMNILKRFNVILDFQNDNVYLKPNSLIATPYNESVDNYFIVGGFGLIVGFLVTVYFF